MFQLAQRNDSYIKLALTGPSGSGKSFSSLKLARGLVGPKGKIAYVDTENGSAKLYSNVTEFFHADLPAPYGYLKFMEAVQAAEKAGFDCIIIDSLSHLWQGILDEKSNIDRKGGSSFSNWSEPTKHLNETIQVILHAGIHVIVCLRVKTEYIVVEETSANSKKKTVSVPKKVGLAPVMKDNIEYEFTTLFEIGMDHKCTTSKDRTGLFVDKTFQIDERTGEQIANWLQNVSPVMPKEEDDEMENVLKMIHAADSKTALTKIGQQIKASTMPEQRKDIVRTAYRERLTSLA